MKNTKLQSPFDANMFDPYQGGASYLPEGFQKVTIVDSVIQANNAKDGGYLKITLRVAEGPGMGATGLMYLNLYNKNEVAARIAHQELSSICWAVGRPIIQDSTELHNLPFVVEVVKEDDDSESKKTTVKGIYNADGSRVVKGQGVQHSAPQVPQAPQTPLGPPSVPVTPQNPVVPPSAPMAPQAPDWGNQAQQAPTNPYQAQQVPQQGGQAPEWAN